MGTVSQLCRTNCPANWGTSRSTLIGVSALCYAAPAVVDALDGNPRCLVWFLQVLACFWSDYVDSGRVAYSHLFDRLLAPTLCCYSFYLALHLDSFLSIFFQMVPAMLCCY